MFVRRRRRKTVAQVLVLLKIAAILLVALLRVHATGRHQPPSQLSMAPPPEGAVMTLHLDLRDRLNRHSATVLADGRILVVGGSETQGPDAIATASEVYDPLTNTWALAGNANARSDKEISGVRFWARGDGSSLESNSIVTGSHGDPFDINTVAYSSVPATASHGLTFGLYYGARPPTDAPADEAAYNYVAHAYDNAITLLAVTDPTGLNTSLTCDGHDHCVDLRSRHDRRTTFVYDRAGNLSTDAIGRSTTFVYDSIRDIGPTIRVKALRQRDAVRATYMPDATQREISVGLVGGGHIAGRVHVEAASSDVTIAYASDGTEPTDSTPVLTGRVSFGAWGAAGTRGEAYLLVDDRRGSLRPSDNVLTSDSVSSEKRSIDSYLDSSEVPEPQYELDLAFRKYSILQMAEPIIRASDIVFLSNRGPPDSLESYSRFQTIFLTVLSHNSGSDDTIVRQVFSMVSRDTLVFVARNHISSVQSLLAVARDPTATQDRNDLSEVTCGSFCSLEV